MDRAVPPQDPERGAESAGNAADSLYAAFEDRFRGSPDEVTRRVAAYLPVLDVAQLKSVGLPVLDLGSGRGEWLDLLGQNGFAAVGVDVNAAFVADARRRGLDVELGDALEYLRGRPDGSCAAVTAFHVVEHLESAARASLLREAFRSLCHGGLLILETPNPENLVVGASSFYLDPTHLSPVPPGLLKFLCEQEGFESVSVARVNADVLGAPLASVPGDAPEALQINAAIHLLNEVFFAAPDYAVVAQKGGGEHTIAGSAQLNRLCASEPLDTASFREEQAEARVDELSAQAEELELRVRAAETGAREAQARASGAAAQLDVVSRSASWRITRPLRSLSAAARGGRNMVKDAEGSPKTLAKLAVGRPSEWLLAQPSVGPRLERGLAAVPFVQRRVEVALHEVEMTRQRARDGEYLPRDLDAVSAGARAVFGDLQARLQFQAG
jgi:SAM-dependent methyltransferase